MEGSLILGLISWWYGARFNQFLKYLQKCFIFLFDFFSVEICLQTLFYVWRRDEIDGNGLSLGEKFQVFVLNLSSRFIGFIIKILTIALYLVVTVIFAFILVYQSYFGLAGP
jgi:hypothetical protein